MHGFAGAIVLLVGICAAVYYWTYCLVKWKGRRQKALVRGLLALLIAFFGSAYLISQDDQLAQKAENKRKQECDAGGFLDRRTCDAAKSAGIGSSKEYQSYLKKQADEEKMLQEAEARKEKQRKADEEAKELACRNSLQCWGDKHSLDAGFACDDLIPKFAKFTSEWTDGLLEPKFSHFRWKDKKAGIVTHIGDKIKFQNGFGAWQHMIYECDYDPIAKIVLDVRVRAGRL